jgi:hypothetical protein
MNQDEMPLAHDSWERGSQGQEEICDVIIEMVYYMSCINCNRY